MQAWLWHAGRPHGLSCTALCIFRLMIIMIGFYINNSGGCRVLNTCPRSPLGDQLILGPTVISSGSELLASHICGGSFIPEEDWNMYIHFSCLLCNASSFHLCSVHGPGVCHHAALQRMVSPHRSAAESVSTSRGGIIRHQQITFHHWNENWGITPFNPSHSCCGVFQPVWGYFIIPPFVMTFWVVLITNLISFL